jgi:hypothetical protein
LTVKENVLTAGANITINRSDPANPIISASGGGGGAGDWGSIGGNIEDQTDLIAALDAKQDTITDSDDVTEGATHLFLTESERTKLGGIQAGAEVNTVDSVNGQTGTVSLDIPDPSDFATAAQGATADTAVQPGDLATVATTGAYSDLSGTPTLGTAASQNSTDFATAAQGTKADTALQSSDIANLVPNTRTVNTKALSSNVTLTQDDVGDGTTYKQYSSTEKTKLAGIASGAQVNTVTSVASKTGAVTLVKGDVGLGNVDNTADASKTFSQSQITNLTTDLGAKVSRGGSATTLWLGTQAAYDAIGTKDAGTVYIVKG